MEPEAEPLGARPGELLSVGIGRDEHGRARDEAVAPRREDARAHAGRETEVVGVDDEPPGHARRVPWTRSRSTVAGRPVAGSVASGSTERMCSSRS